MRGQILADTLTLLQSGGWATYYAHHITTQYSPTQPYFQSFLRPCYGICNMYGFENSRYIGTHFPMGLLRD